MTKLANNLRIAISSTITQNQSFDLTALFLRGPFLSEDSFIRPDAGMDPNDPFDFKTPSFDDQTFSLTIVQDLSASAGNSYSIQIVHAKGTIIEETFNIEIDVVDASSNTINDITVRENQLGQIFDPADVNFGLTNAVSSYSITADGDYVRLNNQNQVELKPSFDPDLDDVTSFSFTIQPSDGTNTADHTVNVTVQRIDDTAPEITLNRINDFSHHLTTDII